MPSLNIHSLNLSSQQATVYIVGVLEMVFLIALVCVYQFNVAPELRTIMKDVFLGWNTALALALNTGGVHRQNSQDGSDTPTPPTTSVKELLPLDPVVAKQAEDTEKK